MFRYKLCSWLAIIFCAQSLASMKNFENDLKQISMAMIVAQLYEKVKVVGLPFVILGSSNSSLSVQNLQIFLS
ncbi:hypothetical protein MKX01_041292 [Papaver californicum]|nr:hypothetical protein MKX01_041292 [Papaver californicum]